MSPARTLDVSDLPPYDISSRSPLFWGQVLLCAIEGTMFFILIATYFYIRMSVDVWPPPGVPSPRPVFATLALIPLAGSCVGSYWASEAAKRNQRRGMIIGLAVNLGLATLFLVLRGIEWDRLNFTWASDAHGSIVWAILFLHTYDVLADMIMTAVLLIIVVTGTYGQKQRIGVHVDSVIWYFLSGIWIPMYVVLYWGDYLVGGAR